MDLLLYVLLARPLLFVNDPVIYWEEKRMDKRGGRFLPGRNGHAGLTLMIKKKKKKTKLRRLLLPLMVSFVLWLFSFLPAGFDPFAYRVLFFFFFFFFLNL
jgi:hypothetical protein